MRNKLKLEKKKNEDDWVEENGWKGRTLYVTKEIRRRWEECKVEKKIWNRRWNLNKDIKRKTDKKRDERNKQKNKTKQNKTKRR